MWVNTMKSSHSQQSRPSDTYVLGVNLFGNDTSASLVRSDGSIVAVAEEERYSGRKGGNRWASPYWVHSVCTEFGVPLEAITDVAYSRIQPLHHLRPQADNARLADNWALITRASRTYLEAQLPNLQGSHEVLHHMCHAASAFYPSPFMSAAIVTSDGIGEIDTATIWRGTTSGLELVWRRQAPHSLGMIYESFAEWLGLSGKEKEGKMMGLAAYGMPIYIDAIEKYLIRPDVALGFVMSSKLENLSPSQWVTYLEELFGDRRNASESLSEGDADFAASIQAVLEKCLLHVLQLARNLSGETCCVVAGGVFSNSVANGVLRRSKIFEELWAQPLSGDNGTSLGAALQIAHSSRKLGKTMMSPFLGSDLGEFGAAAQSGYVVKVASDIVSEAATLLCSGKIIGWVQGRAEIGARALGHRSILALPADLHIKQVINDRVKEREWWRPFAPAVITSDVEHIFGCAINSPYMLFVEPVADPTGLAAAVHIDGHARIQTVSESETDRFAQLLLEIRKRTGLGALLNTSLNGRGQPIARTVHHALEVLDTCGLDALIVDTLVIYTKNQSSPRTRKSTLLNQQWTTSLDHATVVAPWWMPSKSEIIARSSTLEILSIVSPRDYISLLTPSGPSSSIEDNGTDEALILAVPGYCECAQLLFGRSIECLVDIYANNMQDVYILDQSYRLEKWTQLSPQKQNDNASNVLALEFERQLAFGVSALFN